MSYDPDDPRALFQRVIDDITADIRTGRLKPGDRIPSAQQLVQAYGISTMTAQRALQDLRSRGITHGMPGKGTYVRPDAKMRLDHPTGQDFGVGLPHTTDPPLNKRIDAFDTELLRISTSYAVDYEAATGDPYQEERAWEEVQDRLRGEFAANTDLLLAVAHQQAAEDKQLQHLLRSAQAAAARRQTEPPAPPAPTNRTPAKRAPRRKPS
jgi:DNA-binding transcriptional regulator YhcF (GntR family)